MQRREKCGGPGNKDIFNTKAEALEDFRRRHGRQARPGGGNVYPCPWGNHWHITSAGKPGRGKR